MLISDHFTGTCSKPNCSHIALVGGNGICTFCSPTHQSALQQCAACQLSSSRFCHGELSDFSEVFVFVVVVVVRGGWAGVPCGLFPLQSNGPPAPRWGFFPQMVIDHQTTVCGNIACLWQCWAVFHLFRRHSVFLSSNHCIHWPNDYDTRCPES